MIECNPYTTEINIPIRFEALSVKIAKRIFTKKLIEYMTKESVEKYLENEDVNLDIIIYELKNAKVPIELPLTIVYKKYPNKVLDAIYNRLGEGLYIYGPLGDVFYRLYSIGKNVKEIEHISNS